MRRSVTLLMTLFAALGPTEAAVALAARSHAAATHSYRGQGGRMRWGTVQVTITVRGHRITGLLATYPADRTRSRIINGRAVPALRAETLQAQSYQIHLLSGATLTSRAFVGSLYSAMHAAHLA